MGPKKRLPRAPISAEMRAAILAPRSDAEYAAMAVDAFTDHLKSMPDVGGQPRIWVEIAPYSSRGASCKKCSEKIKPNHYRMAVKPGFYSWKPNTSDYYHIKCLEELADWSDPDVLDRLSPMTQDEMKYTTSHWSGMSIAQGVATGCFPVDAGAEMLVREWKDKVKEFVQQRVIEDKQDLQVQTATTTDKADNLVPGINSLPLPAKVPVLDTEGAPFSQSVKDDQAPNEKSPMAKMDENGQSASDGDVSPVSGAELILIDLLHKSGSAHFHPQKPAGMSENRFIELSTKMAPIESDGSDDDDEWDLFDYYIYLDHENSPLKNNLSQMLSAWQFSKGIATAKAEDLTGYGKAEMAKMSPKELRAIQRLSRFSQPDFEDVVDTMLNMRAQPSQSSSAGTKRTNPEQTASDDESSKRQKMV